MNKIVENWMEQEKKHSHNLDLLLSSLCLATSDLVEAYQKHYYGKWISYFDVCFYCYSEKEECFCFRYLSNSEGILTGINKWLTIIQHVVDLSFQPEFKTFSKPLHKEISTLNQLAASSWSNYHKYEESFKYSFFPELKEMIIFLNSILDKFELTREELENEV